MRSSAPTFIYSEFAGDKNPQEMKVEAGGLLATRRSSLGTKQSSSFCSTTSFSRLPPSGASICSISQRIYSPEAPPSPPTPTTKIAIQLPCNKRTVHFCHFLPSAIMRLLSRRSFSLRIPVMSTAGGTRAAKTHTDTRDVISQKKS